MAVNGSRLEGASHPAPLAPRPAPQPPTPAREPGGDRRWRIASACGLVLLVALAVRFGADAGAIWDEEYHFLYGEAVLRWFRSGFADTSAFTYRNLYLYGGLFDSIAQLVVRASPLGIYETRHVLTALVAVLGVVATWRTAALLGGARAGLAAAALLVLTPAWSGHALMNPKDIPFAAFAAWALYGAVRAALAPPPVPLGAALVAGVGAGAAMGVRSGGVFVLGYVVLAALGRVVIAGASSDLRRGPELRRTAIRTAGRLALATAIAWGLMIVAWPWAQVSPLLRPLQAGAEAVRFLQWRGEVLFDGAWQDSAALPRSYLPTWFAITLPELWIAALACAAAAAWSALRRRVAPERLLGVAVLACAAVAPVVAAVALRPVLYDAHRHFLFVLPPAAALAGVGVSAFLSSGAVPRAVRGGAAAVLGALALVAASDMVRLHPYEYVSFNRFAGGLSGAAGRYETDYWGASYREGVEWLVANVAPTTTGPIRVAGCSAPFQVGYYLQTWPAAEGRFVSVDRRAEPDILLATTRWDCHRTPGDVLHVVTRENVPLLYVIRPKRPPER